MSPFPVLATAAAAATSIVAFAGSMSASIPQPLDPGPGAMLAAVVSARGVQVYECTAGAAGPAPAWVMVAPEAQLFDADGRPVGRHGAGPHWQAVDGSRIHGAVLARAQAPTAGAIPWLLLRTRAVGPQGVFSGVTHVQRVNTVGGIAPADGCDAASMGTTARVAYRADYRLFAAAH